MPLSRKPKIFQRAASVVAATILTASVFSASASPAWLGAALPLAAAHVAPITQQSLKISGGVTQVNIVPSSNGVSKVELGNLTVSFDLVPKRIAPELAVVTDLLTKDSVETDIQHAALVSVHQVFAPLSIADLKTAPEMVGERLKNAIQQKLDSGYNGKSPYIITGIELQDACAVKFGMVSDSCTAPIVSAPLRDRLQRSDAPAMAIARKKM